MHPRMVCLQSWSTASLKPSGYFIAQSLTLIKFYVLPTRCIDVFCVDLRTNSGYFPVQHSLIGSYNREGNCLLRGTKRIFICNSAEFTFL